MKINLEIKNIMLIFVSRKKENMDKVKTQGEIARLIEKHYKNANPIYCSLTNEGDYATLIVLGLQTHKMPFVAKRILEAYPSIKFVHFTGGWVEHVYSRQTLKYAGYKLKNAI